jgi:hypothetical protein
MDNSIVKDPSPWSNFELSIEAIEFLNAAPMNKKIEEVKE